MTEARHRFMPSLALALLLYRQTLPVTAVATLAAGALALFWPGRLIWQLMADGSVIPFGLLVLAHSIALALVLGRPNAGSFAYFYSRGFTRDRLWVHQMFATAMSIATVLLAIGLVVWTPLRSLYQAELQRSPYYPGAATLEADLPLRLLLIYLLLLPPLHYAWIRRAQPVLGGSAGWLLVGWIMVVGLPGEVAQLVDPAGLGLFNLVLLLLATQGMRLHRTMEVTR